MYSNNVYFNFFSGFFSSPTNGRERKKVNQYDGSETGGNCAQVRKVKRILCGSLIAIRKSLTHHTSDVFIKRGFQIIFRIIIVSK